MMRYFDLLVPIDHDPLPGHPALSPEELVALFATIDPQWNAVEYVRTVSTSAEIYLVDENGGTLSEARVRRPPVRACPR